MTTAAPTSSFPVGGLSVLAGAIFVSVTAEFLPSGLLPDMAAELEVSAAQIGLLVSVFAATVVIATTPLAALTRGVSRKQLVVVVLAINALATLAAAVAPSYEVLLGARVLAGLAHGLFWAVVGSYSAHLVPSAQLARAVAITGAGGSAAFVLGVPLGTALGHALGWRLAFAAIAGLMVLLCLLVLWLLPPVVHTVTLATGEIALPTRRDPTLPGVIGLGIVIMLAIGGQNLFYTYIAPYIIGPIGFEQSWVGPLLFVYGGAGVIGLVLSGLVAGRRPLGAVVLSVGISIVMLIALGSLAAVSWLAVVLVVVWGVAQGAVAPLFQTRMMQMASPRVRDVAAAWMTTCFNLGIGGGALAGALLLGTWGLVALPFAAAAVMAVALLAVLVIEGPRRAAPVSAGSTKVNATHPTSL